jgi:hypothetical protein
VEGDVRRWVRWEEVKLGRNIIWVEGGMGIVGLVMVWWERKRVVLRFWRDWRT